ncbi:MAG TPA: hypothetical protein VK469_24000 [Candidatus Kapabacteria bacterium]|nr:hypothetical protein [Candidatus Kapabacteria bacterium]
MKTKILILVGLMLIMLLQPGLKAEDVPGQHKVSLSGHAGALLMGDSGLVAVGLNLDYRFNPQFSLGVDLIEGIDSDGGAHTTLFPAVSYHFKLKSEKTDLFAGVGVNTIINEPGNGNNYDFNTTLFGFGGARLFFSRHFGAYFRIFVNHRIFGGFSLGFTCNL